MGGHLLIFTGDATVVVKRIFIKFLSNKVLRQDIMKTIWIIGVGQFGLIAARRLSDIKKDHHFVLVDPVSDNLMRGKGPNRTLVLSDGVDFVDKELSNTNMPEWIVPALPVHLAAQWCLRRFGPDKLRLLQLPETIDAAVPNPLRAADGNVYVSHADFICPDDCAEPKGLCTVTQKPRKSNMFDVLAGIKVPNFDTAVIRSHQLGPGIGGYRPRQLFSLLDQTAAADGNLMICTACRCHGVITGVKRL